MPAIGIARGDAVFNPFRKKDKDRWPGAPSVRPKSPPSSEQPMYPCWYMCVALGPFGPMTYHTPKCGKPNPY